MPRYVALLRGVMPTNCKMSDLRSCFEGAGFKDVKTILASGNVLFTATSGRASALESRIERAMQEDLGRVFYTLVRSIDEIQAVLDADPYPSKRDAKSKRVVTFVRGETKSKMRLPVRRDGAEILKILGREIYTLYVPGSKGAVFMDLLHESFGKEITTRTWETLEKIVRSR